MRSVVAAVLALLLGLGCGGDSPPDPVPDGGPSGVCTAAADCDDGMFCNGVELCVDATCAPAPTPACMAGQMCDEPSERCITECVGGSDADGDGRESVDCGGDDCDDSDRNRFPGNAEVCDPGMHDEDCDPSTFGVRDSDMDAFPDATCCNDDGAGGRRCGTDCDDTLAVVHPTLAEACDGLDNDCDMSIDEMVLTTFFEDVDGDGHGSDEATAMRMQACFRPSGYAESNDDCADDDSGVNPGLAEICDEEVPAVDENCDGDANPSSLCMCVAGGTRMCAAPGVCRFGVEACDAMTGTWLPCSIMGTPEVCNLLDDDCDGAADDGTTVACYDDADNDGFAASGAMTRDECPDPMRTTVGLCPLNTTNVPPVAPSLDCDDMSSMRAPGRGETCNMVDEDCDGRVDEGTTVVCYADQDEDRYPPPMAPRLDRCPDPGRAFVGGCPTNTTNRTPMTGSDCDDDEPAVNPAASEVCEGSVDENCDGMIDPPSDCTCTNGNTRMCPLPGACMAGTETCISGTWSPCSISPSTETCNGVDDNCNGTSDEGTTVPCYADVDNDGYAAAGAMLRAECPDPMRVSVGMCPVNTTNVAPTGPNIDCADMNPMRAPFRGENCNTVDDDCDTVIDEGVTVTCYTDMDEDRYPAPGAMGMPRCPDPGRTFVGGCPVNTTNRTPAMGVDCDEDDPLINPGANEICEGSVDENCDNMIDPPSDCNCVNGTMRMCPEPGVCGAFGSQTCSSGSWGPCSVMPMPESCNGLDDDCDVDTDETFTCQLGSSQQCAVCGRPVSEGSRTCGTGCIWGSCTAPDEECNGCDDDGDGMADDGFLCRQGQTGLACTTACGSTGGTGTCNSTCSGYVMCYRGTEICNYCDDTGDGTFDDEASLPAASVTNDWIPQCTTVDHGLNSCETGAGSGSAPYEESRVLDGTTGIGGWINRVQYNAQPRLGYGEALFHTTIYVRRTIAGNPIDGWAFILSRTGSVSLSGAADELGYVRGGLNGLAFEWRWTPGGAAADNLTVRHLDGSTPGGWTYTVATPVAARLDSGTATTTTIEQELYIYYRPENSATGAIEERLEVRTAPRGFGVTLMTVYGVGFSASCSVSLNCFLTDDLQPGDPLVVATAGQTGPAFGTHTRVRAWWSMGIDFDTSPYDTKFTMTNTCP